MQRFGKLINVNIDWITATCSTADGRRRLQAHGELWIHDELKQGNECVEWSSHGYIGLSCGSVQLGQRHDSLLLRVTGIDAHMKAPTVVQSATNVSRIDFASTVKLRDGQKYFAEACEREARRFKSKHNLVHQVELRRNTNTGNTVYLGRRVSDRFIRIYDKGAESRLEQFEGCWRAECQYNNKLAWSMAQHANRTEWDLAWVHGVVQHELERKGVSWLELQEQTQLNLSHTPKKLSTNASRLLWLGQQVAPTVQKLLDQGLRAQVLEALHLTDEGE